MNSNKKFERKFCTILTIVIVSLLLVLIYCIYMCFYNAKVDFPKFVPGEPQTVTLQSSELLSLVNDPILDPLKVWEFDESQDLQNPELPTGCEATAFSTLCRLNGVEITKQEVADALPKSDGEFVYHFWGNPYSPYGWACMSPCIYNTGVELLSQSPKKVMLYEGVDLNNLPTPCEIWVTINMEDVRYSQYCEEDYKLAYRSHAMVMLEYTDEYVKVVDPLEGITTYPTPQTTKVYNDMGKQAIYITN